MSMWASLWLSGKESTCQCRRLRRHGLDPWVVKIPWRRKWPPTPVFLPGKSRGQGSLAGYMGSQRAGHEWQSEHTQAHTAIAPLGYSSYIYTHVGAYVDTDKCQVIYGLIKVKQVKVTGNARVGRGRAPKSHSWCAMEPGFKFWAFQRQTCGLNHCAEAVKWLWKLAG